MEREELIKEVEKWQNEDNKNRAVLFIAFEKNEQDNMVSQSHGLAGYRQNVVQMIKNPMKNDKDLVDMIREAAADNLCDSIFDRIFSKED